MPLEDMAPVAQGTVQFVKPDSWPNDEKPYVLLYIPTDDLPMANFDFEDVRTIQIRDMRPKKGELSLDREGFMVADFQSCMVYEDYFDEEKLRTIFVKEIRNFLIETLGAKDVYVHEYVMRKREPTQGSGLGRPVPEAHTDYTVSYIRRLIRQLLRDKAEGVLSRRFQMLNLWKPLRGPLRDWPLAMCDYQSLDQKDLICVDEVHKEDILESHGVQYNSSQEWYYLSDMKTDEMLIFKAVDSYVKGEVPHSAFEDSRYPNEPPRESIELRVLVIY